MKVWPPSLILGGKSHLGKICEGGRVASVGRREAGWVRRSGVRGEEERVVVDNESGQL